MPRQIGLKNIYVAKVTKDDSTGCTYETPIKLERAIKATLKPKGSSTKLYSDDAVEDVINAFDSIDVTIELNQLSLKSRALLQGSKLIKGQLIEGKDDIAPTLAFGFQSKKTDGSIRYVWLFKGKFESTDDTYETEAEKIKGQTASLTGSFFARESDGNYRIIADSDEKDFLPETATSWFKGVPVIPTAA